MKMGLTLQTADLSGQISTQTEATKQFQSHTDKLVQAKVIEPEQPLIQLPIDFPKTPATSYQAEHYKFALPERLVESLRSQAQQLNIDERSLLLAAFNALLYRYIHQETIYLKLSVLDDRVSRNYTTEVYTPIDGELKVRALIDHVSAASKSIQDNLEALQNQLLIDNSLNQDSDLPIALTFIESSLSVEAKEQWTVGFQQQTVESTSNPDLHLIILQSQTISGILSYNASLFKPDTIQRLSGHLQVLLEGMVSDLDCPISQLPLLTQTEADQLLVEWQSESIQYPQIPIYQHIEAHAVQEPAAIAVTFQNQQLTYAELNQRANQLAHYLNQVEVGADVRVAVCVEPALEIAVSLLGIFKAGGVYLPLDPTHPIDRLTTILEETQPKVLLTQSHLLPNLPAISAHTLCLDQDWETIQPFPMHNPNNEVALDQVSHLVYTSGTTGKPKGVITSHRNLMNYILVAQERFGFDRHTVMPAIARFTFSITMFELLSPLVAGGTLVILEREHILDFQRLAQTLEQVTVIHTSPSLMQKLLGYIQDKGLDLQRFQGLKHVSTGGDMAPVGLLETIRRVFQKAEVYVIYGCSEVSCMGCSYPVAREQIITKSQVGKPFSNVSVRLYDPDQNLVPIGIAGEIYIGGAGVTQGYLNRADLTQEKFVAIDEQRFYRTGDLGRFDADGNLEILGRSDFQIKLRGIRIELGEIETTLRQAPSVREGVVLARELGASEKSLVAYMVLEPAQNSSIAEIRQFLQAKLPDYMVPAAFVILEALPVNINQKVDRRALPTPTPENLAGFKPFIPPRNEIEQQLTAIWETVLGISPIGIHDHFFEVGGHSLLALSLMTQIETVFGKILPLSTLLTEPTIAQLAALLSQSKQSDRCNSLVLLREGGTQPPVFFIHDGEGETLLYRNLAYCLKPEHPVYGVQPYSRESHPILHTRIAEMAAYYIEQIRTVQPEGPYLLGGLCVGGFLAFEIARQLQNQGQTIAMVALIDTADVEATIRNGLIAQQRLNSFSQSLSQGQQLSHQQRLLYILNKASRKIYNLISYEVQSKLEKVQNQVKIRLFRYYLDRNLPIPPFLHNLPVRIVLKFAEREYIPQAPYRGEVLLFLATQRSSSFDGTPIDDTPYAEIYSDPLLGWGNRATEGVKVYDNPGGHSSMLQEPNVQVMAENMHTYIDAAIANVSASQPTMRAVQQQSENSLVS